MCIRDSYFPTVNGIVNGVQSQQPAGVSTASGTRASYGPSVSVSYLLFDVGGRRGTVAIAWETAFAEAYTHNRTVQATVLQVEQAYFGYVGARALRDAQRTSVRDAQASYGAAR